MGNIVVSLFCTTYLWATLIAFCFLTQRRKGANMRGKLSLNNSTVFILLILIQKRKSRRGLIRVAPGANRGQKFACSSTSTGLNFHAHFF